MKIGQVAPLYESVPPKFYGGTERVVFYLTEELVRQGHDVTLFASADSRTNAHLDALDIPALRLSGSGVPDTAAHYLLMEKALRQEDAFDILHFHVDFLHFPLTRRSVVPHLTTLHGRLDLPGLDALYKEYGDQPVVAISESQKRDLRDAFWVKTIYHGLPTDRYTLGRGAGGYLAFLGRITPEKGPEAAIAIAREAGIPLRIAAKVDPVDREYFETCVKPLIDGHSVIYVGEVDEAGKNAFLGEALALLFPIDWPEPFGLVMIEAMACGTPVIAYRRGSVPEVIDDGVTGIMVEDHAGAVAALRDLDRFDRRAVRAGFEARFTVERMAQDYVDLYGTLRQAERAAEAPWGQRPSLFGTNQRVAA